ADGVPHLTTGPSVAPAWPRIFPSSSSSTASGRRRVRGGPRGGWGWETNRHHALVKAVVPPTEPGDSSVSQHLVCGLLCAGVYVAWRHYRRHATKSMNFDNPVYRKTTGDGEEDEIHIGRADAMTTHLVLGHGQQQQQQQQQQSHHHHHHHQQHHQHHNLHHAYPPGVMTTTTSTGVGGGGVGGGGVGGGSGGTCPQFITLPLGGSMADPGTHWYTEQPMLSVPAK
ncbi:hypothetical protein CRUP_000517, partial [Coryphaenoides rupestris]